MANLVTTEIIEKNFPDATVAEQLALLARVKAVIEEYCNTKFEEVTYTAEKLDSTDNLIAKHMPIIEVISLVDNGTTLVEDTDFYMYPSRIEIISPSGSKRGIRLTYKAGMPTIPEMVKLIAEDLIRYWAFKDTEGTQLFYKNQVFEEREYTTNLDLNEAKILKRLKQYIQQKVESSTRGGLKMGYIR